MDIRKRKWIIRIHIINQTEKGIYEYNIDELIKDLYSRYQYVIYIKHNTDNPHYHLIIQSRNPIQFKTLKKIFPFGNIETQFGTNQQAYDYLIHKNIEDKKQYEEKEIKTNLTESQLKEWLYNEDKESQSFGDKLLNDIETCSSLWEVFKKNSSAWQQANNIQFLWNTYQREKMLKITRQMKEIFPGSYIEYEDEESLIRKIKN